MPSFWEKVRVEDREMDLYASVPSGRGPFRRWSWPIPASGVGEFTQSIADRLAAEGYAAVAPNRFHRVPEHALADRTAGQYLNDPETVLDMNATVDFLKEPPGRCRRPYRHYRLLFGGAHSVAVSRHQPSTTGPSCPSTAAISRPKLARPPRRPSSWPGASPVPCSSTFGEIDGNPSQEDMRQAGRRIDQAGQGTPVHYAPGRRPRLPGPDGKSGTTKGLRPPPGPKPWISWPSA